MSQITPKNKSALPTFSPFSSAQIPLNFTYTNLKNLYLNVPKFLNLPKSPTQTTPRVSTPPPSAFFHEGGGKCAALEGKLKNRINQFGNNVPLDSASKNTWNGESCVQVRVDGGGCGRLEEKVRDESKWLFSPEHDSSRRRQSAKRKKKKKLFRTLKAN